MTTAKKYHCKRCGRDFDPVVKRRTKPVACPHCHSALWDKDYVRGPKAKRAS